jgi:phage terminase small subunit
VWNFVSFIRVKKMALTGKMLAWANAWLETRNKTESSRIANYKGNDATLASIGYENFKKLEIQEYIKQRLDELAMPAEEVLERLARMARANIADFAHVQTNADLAALGDKGLLVKKFKRKKTFTQAGNEYEEIELELYPADVNLERVGRYHGLFTDKTEISGPDGAPLQFSEIVVNVKSVAD